MSESGPKLISCRICGVIMVKLSRDVCNECFRKEEDLFGKVREFLRRNPGISIPDLAVAVGATEEQIEMFIASGRLERIGAQIAHQCQTCNKIIMTGLICQECTKSLKEQVSNLQRAGERAAENKSQPPAGGPPGQKSPDNAKKPPQKDTGGFHVGKPRKG